ncbi:protein dead ringer homolog [Uloborus diversus]|uniref:protein dead ringer homolog n=1 Tax=Uloborus diversus TaxID=327109 RepID=UPI0024094B4E|nr:protein dead ringer homolog [Uloborus diversus]
MNKGKYEWLFNPDSCNFNRQQIVFATLDDLFQIGMLYELSDDPRRKSFLDDLFSYMQKRGTPVTRIPIMAKQVLDLYELYRLVVARGGLVEVINKKIWREITKGLNLPSSITSAAFTLRTQYMKYLYAYECDKEKLSSAEELQAAIDGNRREGRRSSYGTYADVVPGRSHPPQLNSPLSLVSRHMNGHASNHGGRGSSSPLQLAYYPPHSSAPLNLASSHENGIYGNHALSSGFVQFGVVPPPESYSNSTKDFSKVPSPDFDQNNSPKDLSKDSSYKNGRRSSEDDNCNSVPSTPNPLAMPQEQALNLEVSRNNNSSTTNNGGADHKPPMGLLRDPDSHHHNSSSKRPKIEEDRLSRSGMPSTHIKITSNRDGRTQSDGSLMVSMEVNGILYQGVLLAAPNHRNRL